MSYFDIYKQRVNFDGTSQKERYVGELQRDLLNKFKDSSSYQEVYLNNSQNPTGVRIVEENSLNKNPNKKRILMKPGDSITVGTTVLWGLDYWLVTDLDDTEVYFVGIIDKCNNSIKLSSIKSIPCICTNKSLYTSGIQDNKLITIPDTKLNITCAVNEDTLKFERDYRMLFGFSGKYYAYKVSMIDGVSQPGILTLVVEETGMLPEDDLVNGIAYNPITPAIPTNLAIQASDNKNEVKINTTKVFSVANNTLGYKYNWSLTNTDGSATTYASIVTSTDTDVTIKGVTSGRQVKITAVEKTNSSTLSLIVNVISAF